MSWGWWLATALQSTDDKYSRAILFFFNPHLRTYLLILEGEEERKRNINVREKQWLVVSHTCSDLGSYLQPRYLLQPGIEPTTFGVGDNALTNWATWPGLGQFLTLCLHSCWVSMIGFWRVSLTPLKLYEKCQMCVFLETGFMVWREGKVREKEKERNISVWLPLMCAPYWGPGPQPRHVPWLGIEPATLWFSGQHSIHWAAPARAGFMALIRFSKGFVTLTRIRTTESTSPCLVQHQKARVAEVEAKQDPENAFLSALEEWEGGCLELIMPLGLYP